MPNWCGNRVVIRGANAKLKKLATAFKRQKLLSTVLPEPDYDKVPVLSSFPEFSGTIKKKPVDPKEAWYDWRIQNWGTKWDVGGPESAEPELKGKELKLAFDSAWSPPVQIFRALTEQGFEVEALWHEGGMAFAGRYIDGDEENYDAGCSGDLRDMPSEIDEAFGLTEYFKDIEEDD